MSVPLTQQIRVARYILGKRIKGVKRYPLTLMLEPLFQCNLACPGCGKIDYDDPTLRKRMSAQECLDAVDECGAPMVSLAGGEPLVHKEIKEIVDGIIERGKYLYLCTNAILLEKKLDLFTPSRQLTFSIHLDGMQARHDESVDRDGVFDKVVSAIHEAKRRGFRVNINTTLFQTADPDEIAEFFDFATNDLKVDGITFSPGFAYEHAPRQDVFMGRRQSKELFRKIFKNKKERQSKWPLSQSSLFVDFACGNQGYQCQAWSMPCRNLFGWQRPCYLLVDEGYVQTFRELIEDTNWKNYGVGRNPKCANCMAHCGFEGTAADDAFRHPLKAMMSSIRGPRTDGQMASDPPLMYEIDEDGHAEASRQILPADIIRKADLDKETDKEHEVV